jgi:hypothetical protein
MAPRLDHDIARRHPVCEVIQPTTGHSQLATASGDQVITGRQSAGIAAEVCNSAARHYWMELTT